MANDIVYFCKEAQTNEELTYSIRSVEKNFPFRKIWLYGKCPENLDFEKAGTYVHVSQIGAHKWDRVRNMFRVAALNDEITEDFYLFNDDFFVMEKVDSIPVYYRCSLPKHIIDMELKFGNKPTHYTEELRKTYVALTEAGFSFNSYELHMPFKFNRAKLLQTIGAFPNNHCTRTLYGNMFNVGGEEMDDVKIYGRKMESDLKNKTFLSTDDSSWENNTSGVTDYIKEKFKEKSSYEK